MIDSATSAMLLSIMSGALPLLQRSHKCKPTEAKKFSLIKLDRTYIEQGLHKQLQKVRQPCLKVSNIFKSDSAFNTRFLFHFREKLETSDTRDCVTKRDKRQNSEQAVSPTSVGKRAKCQHGW